MRQFFTLLTVATVLTSLCFFPPVGILFALATTPFMAATFGNLAFNAAVLAVVGLSLGVAVAVGHGVGALFQRAKNFFCNSTVSSTVDDDDMSSSLGSIPPALESSHESTSTKDEEVQVMQVVAISERESQNVRNALGTSHNSTKDAEVQMELVATSEAGSQTKKYGKARKFFHAKGKEALGAAEALEASEEQENEKSMNNTPF